MAVIDSVPRCDAIVREWLQNDVSLVFDDDAEICSTELFDHFTEWLKDRSNDFIHPLDWCKALAKKGYERVDWSSSDYGTWKGIGIKPEDVEPEPEPERGEARAGTDHRASEGAG